MHPDLVGASGKQLAFQQCPMGRQSRRAAEVQRLQTPKARCRRLPLNIDTHSTLASRREVAQQRKLHQHRPRPPPVPFHDGQVAFLHLAGGKHPVQGQQGRTSLGNDQQTRGVAVQTVGQLQELAGRARGAQPLDEAGRDAAAAMHGQPLGFVHHQQVLVLEEDADVAAVQLGASSRGPRSQCRLRHAGQRRHPNPLTGGHALLGLAPAPIDAYLALADHPVDARLGHATQHGQQVVVQALPLVALVHRQPLDGCCLRHGRFCVGVFHPAIIAGGCRSCRQGVANRAIPLKIRRFSAACARVRFRRQGPPAGYRAVCSVKEGLDFFPCPPAPLPGAPAPAPALPAAAPARRATSPAWTALSGLCPACPDDDHWIQNAASKGSAREHDSTR